MTSVTDDLRLPKGLSSMKKRPLFRVGFEPSTPMKELIFATSGH